MIYRDVGIVRTMDLGGRCRVTFGIPGRIEDSNLRGDYGVLLRITHPKAYTQFQRFSLQWIRIGFIASSRPNYDHVKIIWSP